MQDFEVPSEVITIVIFALAFLFVVLCLLWLIGVFRTLVFEPTKLAPMTFAYKTFRGPYAEGGPHFAALLKFMKRHGFDTSITPSAGIYYDDPKTTTVTRYAVGFLIKQDDTASKKKWVKFQQDSKEEAKEWSVLELKDTPTIVSVFPMHLIVIQSAVSAMKTYPAFEATAYEIKSGSMEIYRTDNKTVETHFPQGNYDQFCPQESDSFAPASDEKKVQ